MQDLVVRLNRVAKDVGEVVAKVRAPKHPATKPAKNCPPGTKKNPKTGRCIKPRGYQSLPHGWEKKGELVARLRVVADKIDERQTTAHQERACMSTHMRNGPMKDISLRLRVVAKTLEATDDIRYWIAIRMGTGAAVLVTSPNARVLPRGVGVRYQKVFGPFDNKPDALKWAVMYKTSPMYKKLRREMVTDPDTTVT